MSVISLSNASLSEKKSMDQVHILVI